MDQEHELSDKQNTLADFLHSLVLLWFNVLKESFMRHLSTPDSYFINFLYIYV